MNGRRSIIADNCELMDLLSRGLGPLTWSLLDSLRPLPLKDCERCIYRTEPWRDGGHCYMFREAPDGEFCGQMKAKEHQ